jgi:hypothetical protein
MQDALSPAERQGFDIAVKYSLKRNSNARLAAIGAKIARRDSDVQEARTADRDVFYWLGFDIATGLFGDPALARTVTLRPVPVRSRYATPLVRRDSKA